MTIRVEVNEDPNTAADKIADAALEAAEQAASENDAEIDRIVVLVSLSKTPDGWDHSVGASGIEENEDLLEVLLIHARATAEACGIGMAVVPVKGQG